MSVLVFPFTLALLSEKTDGAGLIFQAVSDPIRRPILAFSMRVPPSYLRRPSKALVRPC